MIMSDRTASQLTKQQIAEYQRGTQRRKSGQQNQLHGRFQRAWEAARQSAKLLKTDFRAERVAVFGSLLDEKLFHLRSDIDLAVWGLDEKEYYRAVGILQSIDPDFSIDMIMVEEASPALQTIILAEGQTL